MLVVACINLSTKSTEQHRKLRDIISVVYCSVNKEEFMKITQARFLLVCIMDRNIGRYATLLDN